MKPRLTVAAAGLASALLGGCSLSGAVTRTTLDYDQALEAVTNDMLVTNILLARDQAPLHFTDLSQIRGSLQLQAQAQASEPFGSEFTSEDRDRAMLSGMVGGASNPTFDVVPLNTKEFTEGITAPIDARYFVYFFNKEQDDDHQNTIARLLFDKIRIVWRDGTGAHACSYFNSPDQQRPFASDSTCAAESERVFGVGGTAAFGYVANALLENSIYVKKEPTSIGPGFSVAGADLLRQANMFAGDGLSLRLQDQGADGRYVLSRENKDGVLCLGRPSNPAGPPQRTSWLIVHLATLGDPVSLSADEDPDHVCNGDRVSRGSAVPAPVIYLYVRSVETIFHYLGRMLTYRPEDRVIPFYIDDRRPAVPRFSVRYLGKTYYVSESFASCEGQDPSRAFSINRNCQYDARGRASGRDRGDQTLFILSVLNQLLDLYKKASDIPATPAVQAVH